MKRFDPLLGDLEVVSGAVKGHFHGSVIHSDGMFSTAFPELSTGLGKELVLSVAMRRREPT
jgi:hypothetical protein